LRRFAGKLDADEENRSAFCFDERTKAVGSDFPSPAEALAVVRGIRHG
jgi:hypothetical protein